MLVKRVFIPNEANNLDSISYLDNSISFWLFLLSAFLRSFVLEPNWTLVLSQTQGFRQFVFFMRGRVFVESIEIGQGDALVTSKFGSTPYPKLS